MSTTVTDLATRREAAEHAKYAALVMDAWDRQNPDEKQAKRVGKPSTLDTNPEVRRKAKSQL
jgi:hypothetical protein